ncbi:hypothetical protein CgunFtcFv8_020060 [Champsocephalus gunnari]|uniref:Uncharacterized protein n=2 Tax=Champsocephalus TaxID=52236 RepID=A0AAN8DIJ5_CHAGU|nr:hypothetical protein CgunFtcFv8_020060 [Champsocephalus gunnari]
MIRNDLSFTTDLEVRTVLSQSALIIHIMTKDLIQRPYRQSVIFIEEVWSDEQSGIRQHFGSLGQEFLLQHGHSGATPHGKYRAVETGSQDFAVRNSSRLAFLPPDTSAEERIII